MNFITCTKASQTSSATKKDNNSPKTEPTSNNHDSDSSYIDQSNVTEDTSQTEAADAKKSTVKSSKSKPSAKSAAAPRTTSTKSLVNKRLGNVKTLSSIINTSITNTSAFLNSPRCSSNRKITDFFQIRKSSRKCKSDIEKEKRAHIEEAIRTGVEEGLEVRTLDSKGRAIFATRHFARGEFVCEYYGEMISYASAKKREQAYNKDANIGCYMYFFEYKSVRWCIDATAESTRLGRLLNHSKLDGNCQTKLFEIDSKPHLILVAARDIRPGEEMTYDYGDRNKVSLESHPWLAQ